VSLFSVLTEPSKLTFGAGFCRGECLTDLVITVTCAYRNFNVLTLPIPDSQHLSADLLLLYKRLAGGNEVVTSTMKLIGILTIRSAAYTTIFAMLAAISAQAFPTLPYYDILYAFCSPLREFGVFILLDS